MNNAGLAAHGHQAACPTCSPTIAPVPGSAMLAAGPEGLSYLDNGSCYRSKVHGQVCRELGLRHLRTRPYRPRTNGKAERFIQTLKNRWAHGALYANSAERTAALPGWLTHYNFDRRHGALGHRTPAARLAELEQRRE